MTLIFSLIMIQAFWAGSYVAMKFAMMDIPVGLIIIGRYAVAVLIFLSLGFFKGGLRFRLRDWLLMVGIALATFVVSPYCQIKSLGLTQVMDVSILISLEPLVTALVAAFFLKERLSWDLIAVFFVSTIGVLILSGVNFSGVASSGLSAGRLLGNLIFMVSILCEAVYSTGGRHLTQRNLSPLRLVAWIHLLGLVINGAIYFPELKTFNYGSVSWVSWASVFYLGAFCSGIGYAVWMVLAKKIRVSYLALSLFLQPVFGPLFGFFLMGEKVDSQLILGGGLILLTLIVWTLSQFRRTGAWSVQNV